MPVHFLCQLTNSLSNDARPIYSRAFYHDALGDFHSPVPRARITVSRAQRSERAVHYALRQSPHAPPSASAIYAVSDPGQYEDRTAGLAFVSHLYPQVDIECIADAVADRYMGLLTREGQLQFDERLELAPEPWPSQVAREPNTAGCRGARTCLERCLAKLEAIDFDIVGFSLTFETQLISSLALARLVKQRWPEKTILFGGAACTSVQGVAMFRALRFHRRRVLGRR